MKKAHRKVGFFVAVNFNHGEHRVAPRSLDVTFGIMATLHHFTFSTPFPVGALTLAASEKGLAVLSFRGIDEYRGSPHFKDVDWVESREAVQPYFNVVNRYLRGESRELDMKLDLRG